ncbi:hypothetical protein J5N97_027676 [Dioscorea zingiberensis]|uniref:Uncharacterized protein n=1 Tax=Dioscorea zingiberensis TaxID=325984 RepID=A0A9D5H466_9LILI|nr:hypothetical protein J5N97_027676 [Dioscorea zingiberensis]
MPRQHFQAAEWNRVLSCFVVVLHLPISKRLVFLSKLPELAGKNRSIKSCYSDRHSFPVRRSSRGNAGQPRRSFASDRPRWGTIAEEEEQGGSDLIVDYVKVFVGRTSSLLFGSIETKEHGTSTPLSHLPRLAKTARPARRCARPGQSASLSARPPDEQPSYASEAPAKAAQASRRLQPESSALAQNCQRLVAAQRCR